VKHTWNDNRLDTPGGYVLRAPVEDDDFDNPDHIVYIAFVWTFDKSHSATADRVLYVGRYQSVDAAKRRIAQFNTARRNLHSGRKLHN